MMSILTTIQAATRLGVTPGRVRQLIKAGQLPAVKHGRDWLIDERHIRLVEIRGQLGRPRNETKSRRAKEVCHVDSFEPSTA